MRRIDSEAFLEDALWMRDTGEHPERAAQRLGVALSTLEAAIRRHGLDWPGLRGALSSQRRRHERAAA